MLQAMHLCPLRVTMFGSCTTDTSFVLMVYIYTASLLTTAVDDLVSANAGCTGITPFSAALWCNNTVIAGSDSSCR